MKNARRKLPWLAAIAAVTVTAACGGGFTREEAMDTLMVEVGMTESQAACSVDALEAEKGSLDLLENPDAASEDDAFLLGELMVGCIEPSLATPDTTEPDTSASDTTEAASEPAVEEPALEEEEASPPVAAAPGVGDWTAAQLCTLVDGAEVSGAFGAAAVAIPFEQWEDETRSICAWNDPDSVEAVPPALLLADQEPAPGPLFIDGTPVDIAGADEVDYRPDWLPGEDFLVLTSAGEQLTLRYQSGAPAAFDLAVQAATAWAAVQSQ